MMKNQQVVFVRRPDGPVTPACYDIRDAPVPAPEDDDVLVRNIYLSCDPYMRGRMGSKFALDAVIPARVVGQVAGQIAKLRGCRVVGSAGSDEKVAHIVDRLGFDAAFNYQTASSIGAALDEHCPGGIDIYFDNVGGATLEAVLERINPGARIPVCGQISHYDAAERREPRHLDALEKQGAILRKFSIYDNMGQYDDFLPWISARMKAGEIVYFEDIVAGIDNMPAAFIGMMAGENLGKRLVRVSDDPTR